jgi:hypothetical protein
VINQTGYIRIDKPASSGPVVSGCIDPMVWNTYFVVTRDGNIYSVGTTHTFTSAAVQISTPVVSIVCSPDGDYVWILSRNGNAVEETVSS